MAHWSSNSEQTELHELERTKLDLMYFNAFIKIVDSNTNFAHVSNNQTQVEFQSDEARHSAAYALFFQQMFPTEADKPPC